MNKKTFIFCVMFSLFLTVNAQKKRSTVLGKTNLEELKMKSYEKDTIANAVVLYEHANYYVNEHKRFQKTTDYYFRVKILNKEGLNKANISLRLYNGDEIENIEAKTYNLDGSDNMTIDVLEKDKIYTKNNEVLFAMPNVKVGSVIEYRYSITTPSSRIRDWYFQSDIPKVKSDFTAAIMGNYKYDIRVIGGLKLTTDSATVKKNCVYVPIIGVGACLIISYGIENIPAFKEEDYMLSKRNYISRLNFELNSYTKVNGMKRNFTKTWKAADKSIKSRLLDGQSSKSNFFKKNIIPKEFFSLETNLQKAKKVYQLVQNNFEWNGDYWPSQKVKIKNAFKNRTGNIFDINLSLFNALKAVGIDCNIALLSTRSKGLPTKLHPSDSEFNYLIVKAPIDGKVYFLDATSKLFPFGLVRFEALNGQARIMDFKNGSYWEDIRLSQKSSTIRKMSLELIDDGFKGELVVTNTGYDAVSDRRNIKGKKNEELLEGIENVYPAITAESLKFTNKNDIDKKLIASYKINIESDINATGVYLLNPFFTKFFKENPFKLENRTYPVNFGHKRSYTYVLSLKIPENYTITKLPKNKSMSLPNKGGRVLFSINKKENTINLYFKLTINKKNYSVENYSFLKEFFNQLVKIQENVIELEKK